MPLENFFDKNGQLNVIYLKQRAQELWERKKGNQIGSCHHMNASEKNIYKLTDKQIAFINEGQLFFKGIYVEIQNGYKEKNAFHLSESFQRVMDGYFKNKKYNNMLGQPSAAESGGFFRGLVAFLIYKRDQESKEKAEAEAKFLKELEPMMLFFVDYETAKIIFVEFLLHLAMRFQNAIEILDNHQEGVMNLARFVVTFFLLDTKKYGLYKGSDLDGKVLFLINSLVERPEALSETLKEWGCPQLRTVGSARESAWTIDGLLHKSPIETQKGLYLYSGKDETKNALHYPAQIVPDAEEGKLMLYKAI